MERFNKQGWMRPMLYGGVGVFLLCLLQALVGSFPVALFRFPVNGLLLLAFGIGVVELYRRREQSPWAQFLLSREGTHLSLLFMALLGLALGLQREAASTAWPVVGMLLFLLAQLGMVILRGWRTGQGIRWHFLLLHLGLWLALTAGLFGAADRETYRAVVRPESPSREAFDSAQRMTLLEYPLQLHRFEMTHYANGAPASWLAEVVIEEEVIPLRVNQPYAPNWQDRIYLVSYDPEASPQACRYCVVEVVREPWQWMTAAGLWMMMLGALWLFVGREKRIKQDNRGGL